MHSPKLIVLLCFGALTACSRVTLPFEIGRAFELPKPEDTSTADQRFEIEKALVEIEYYARLKDPTANFHQIPIVVTPMVMRYGFCQRNAQDAGQYIHLSPKIFGHQARYNQVFSVLLHEIGHCYFNRQHEFEFISKTNYLLHIEAMDSEGEIGIVYDRFSPSIMTMDEAWGGNDLADRFPNEFKSYYVNELYRLERMDSFEQILHRFPTIQEMN